MSEFQSNSAFPTSNFNTRLPFVRYDFPSVFPTMSAQESRRLWCILKDHPRPGPYYISDIALDANVYQLKEMITQNIKDLHNADADSLKLLKLNKTVSVDPDHSLAQRLAALGDIAMCSTELSSAEKVGKLFPEPHSQGHLHIVVRILEPSASRKRLLGEEDGREAKRQKIDLDLAWLVELHSKIWNQGEERSKTLFHKVEVTVAHYRELQRRLETRPNRDSNEDIPAIKRGILLHYKPNHNTPGNEAKESVDEANVSEENENGDEDPELGSFLPTTFEFFDLSSLELKHEQPRLPLPLLVRPEYSVILDRIRLEKEVDCSNSHTVSGQPGTGKTAFLHYMMIKYMLDGIPFLYQSIHGTVYHVSEKVEIIESWGRSENVVAFVDADGMESNQHIPKAFLRQQCVQFILASSPKGVSPKWMKQINDMFMFEWVVQLWTSQELFVTGIFLHPKHLDLALLRESTSYFGFNPRQCFQASGSKLKLEARRLIVSRTIHSMDKNISLYDLVSGTLNSKHIPHTVFELFPLGDTRLLAQAQVRAVSQWALEQLLEEYDNREANAALELYKMLAGIAAAGPLRGDMFQLRALKYFDKIHQPRTFKIRNLTTNENLDWRYPGPAPRRAFQTRDLTGVLKETVQQQRSRHLVPLAPNYAAVDSILYEPNSVLTGLQVTIKKEHPVAVSGLQRIQQSLKLNMPLADLQPGIPKEKHWRLIFVVPEEDADSFGLQKFEGDTAKNAWAQKVDQYVLGLNVDETFKN